MADTNPPRNVMAPSEMGRGQTPSSSPGNAPELASDPLEFRKETLKLLTQILDVLKSLDNKTPVGGRGPGT
nr:hypothetical protein CFP56_59989 [Quercus suber]